MKCFRAALMFVLGVFLFLPDGIRAENTSYTLAVIPQLKPSELHSKWSPFVKKLSEEVGVNIQISTYYPSITKFDDDLKKGVPDFAFMNPYEAAVTGKSPGYIPLVRDKKPLVGIIVVRKEGGIKYVKDLSEKEMAFPDPNAFAASLYLRAVLTEHEKIHVKPIYVENHQNVYKSVALHNTPAGGGVNNTLMRQPDEIKNNLQIIYETPASAPHPLSAHPRVPAALREKVIVAILKLAADPANKEMLDNIQMPDPVHADLEKDYIQLKKLKLERYIDNTEK